MIAMNGMDEKDVIQKYVTENNFTFRIGMAKVKGAKSYDVAEQYGVQAYPTNYLIGSDGKVLWSAVGFDEAGLLAAMKKAGF